MLPTRDGQLFFPTTQFNRTDWLNNRKIEEGIKNQRLRILIIDDTSKFRISMAKLLRTTYGASVIEVDTGAAGIDLVKSGDVFNIIFLDLLMPGKNGLETYHELREWDPACRIVIMSAHQSCAEWQKATEMDLEVIKKPIYKDTLMSILREL